METVFLRGGLGNQFFQWIYALYLQENGSQVVLDSSFLRKRHGNQAKGEVELTEIFSDLYIPLEANFSSFVLVEPLFVRAAHLVSLLRNERSRFHIPFLMPKLHYGYYQRSYYFLNKIRSRIRRSLKSNLTSKDFPLFPKFLVEKSYVAIHVRGGDYLSGSGNLEELGVLSKKYYEDVFEILNQDEFEDYEFIVVTDDSKRAIEIFSDNKFDNFNISYLADISPSSGNSLIALSVMLNANVLVCANSSFSALCGYLNSSDTVFYPKPWFRGPNLRETKPGLDNWRGIDSAFETI